MKVICESCATADLGPCSCGCRCGNAATSDALGRPLCDQCFMTATQMMTPEDFEAGLAAFKAKLAAAKAGPMVPLPPGTTIEFPPLTADRLAALEQRVAWLEEAMTRATGELPSRAVRPDAVVDSPPP